MARNLNLNLKVLSLNVRGINEERKRKSLFRWVKRNHVDVLFFQETYCTEKVEQVWKNQWGGNIISSYGTNHSKGVTVLFKPGLDVDILNTKRDDNGRMLLLDVRIQGTVFKLVNIYSPNSQHNQTQFFNRLKQIMAEYIDDHDNILIGGDFNFIVDINLDRKGGSEIRKTQTRERISNCLDEIMSTFNLQDIWRVKNPDTKRFTWHRRENQIHSRLDYWLISKALQDHVEKVDILPAIRTDHSAITVDFKSFKDEEKGRGYWRLNTTFLEEATFIQGILEQKETWLMEVATTNDARERWEYLKYKIRQYATQYGKQRAKDRRERENNLEKRLKTLEEECDKLDLGTEEYTRNTEEIGTVKAELQELDDYKIKGLILRSRCQWYEEGEKSTKYFLKLETRNREQKTMNKLRKETGEYTVDPQEIRKMQAEFYQNLYKLKQTAEPDETCGYLADIEVPTLNEEDRGTCEGLLTFKECETVLRTFKNGKAPGNDGIPAEFYKKFWPVFGTFLVDSLNTSYMKGELSSSQKQAVIALIDKGKDRTLLKNWRPISLLNVDAKLASKVIASRMVKVLPKLLHENQVGYVQDRNITENIRTIQDLLNTTKIKETPGLMIMIDFEKAFDSLDWKFLDLALKKFEFGPSVINWVKTFYTGASSCVINNGVTSQYFPVERGVRQGDPLSPYLFILAVEILACAIRQNKDIKGIETGGTEIKVLQYADDTSVILKDIQSAKKFLKTVDTFGQFSGLKLNKGKTEAIWLGSNRHRTDTPLDIAWSQTPVRVLGVYVSYDKAECNKYNFESKIKKAKTILNLWKMRNLTLIGRIQIIKTFIISQFLFACSVISIPDGYVNQINSMIYRFVWNGGSDKIKRSTLVSTYENGGLNAPDIRKMIEVARIKWICKYMSVGSGVWKQYFEQYLKDVGMNLKWILRSNFDMKMLKGRIPDFYYEVLLLWSKIGECTPLKKDRVIWYNKLVTIDNKPVYYEKFERAGLYYIDDMYDTQGRLKPFDFWLSKDVPQNMYLSWRGLVANVKDNANKCTKYDTGPPQLVFKLDDTIHQLNTVSSRMLYQEFLKQSIGDECNVPKVAKYLPDKNYNWKSVFQMMLTPVDVRTRDFQYRFLFDILCNNHKLQKWHLRNDHLCDFCKESDEVLEHLFWECHLVKSFWKDLNKKYNFVFEVPVTRDEVFLGSTNELKCCLIFAAKRFIYACKYKGTLPNIDGFKQTIESIRKIELTIAHRKNTMHKWLQKWEMLN